MYRAPFPQDVPVDLHIKALVGYQGSQRYHVFELTRQMPRFAMYGLGKEGGQGAPPPQGYVVFTLQERVARVYTIAECFAGYAHLTFCSF